MRRATTAFFLLTLLLADLPAPAQQQVDLNGATAEQLDALPGIGPAKARAILEYRAANGPFRTVDALLEVKGIGPATLARLRPYVFVGAAGGGSAAPAPETPPAAAADTVAAPAPPGGFYLDLTSDDGTPRDAAARGGRERASARETPAEAPPAGVPAATRIAADEDDPTGRININTADEETLRRLPGIGPAKARAIVSRRSASGPFRSPDQLTEVPGIGEKTLSRLRPRITVRVDLNAADLQALESIGLDTASAERLMRWRKEHGPFQRVDDLVQVPGFGRGALETLRSLVWVAPGAGRR